MKLQSLMYVLLSVIALLAAAIVVLFIILGIESRSGAAPGLLASHLARCPARPNCVCSEYREDAAHYIEPIPLSRNPNPMPMIKSVIEAAGGTIQQQTDSYLAAIFSSTVFGFVDDVEVRLDAETHSMQLRSASRVGHSDMGVNRRRVEMLKQMFNEKLNAGDK